MGLGGVQRGRNRKERIKRRGSALFPRPDPISLSEVLAARLPDEVLHIGHRTYNFYLRTTNSDKSVIFVLVNSTSPKIAILTLVLSNFRLNRINPILILKCLIVQVNSF